MSLIAPWYSIMYVKLDRIAMRHGYALTLHGSMARDLDLVAVPWMEDADDPKVLIKAFAGFIAERAQSLNYGYAPPAKKPHGRLSYILPIGMDENYYLDISVMPRQKGIEK